MRAILSAAMLLLICSGHLWSQITVCNYQYRKRIAFDPNRVSGSSDLTDFPVLLQLTADPDLETVANGGHVQNNSGFDIIFTSDDGVTILNHDLESYSPTTGALTVWVKIPVLSTSINTYIYMYYGNSAIATDQSSSNTWSNGFVGVWHLNNSLVNETSTAGLNGTNQGSTNSATAKFGSARNFVRGSSQYVDVTPYNSAYDINTEITFSGWVRLSSTGNDQKIAGNQDNANGGWKFGVFSDNKIEFEIRTSGNSPFLSRSASGGQALAVNTWYYVVGQYSDAGNFIRTYRNGNVDRHYNTTASAGQSTGTMKFSREPFAGTGYFDGNMDELRLSNVIRSADWILTEYENQNSPSTFYTIHSEPRVWDGSASNQWTNGNNWSGNVVPAADEDVIIPNVGTDPVLNSSPSIGAMWIQPGGVFNNGANTRTISVAYDILNCGTYTGNNGHLRLNTNTIQVQHLSGSGNFNLAKLIVDNQFWISPTTRLNRIVNVAQSLTLLSGLVGTDATNILALGNNATSTSGSQQCFIHGPMSKSGSANFVFPLGKGQEWRRIGISGLTAASTFTAEYFDSPYGSGGPVNAPMDNVSTIEYWQLDRNGAGGSANVSLYWENVAYSGIDDCPDLTIARWNGSAWVEHAASAVPGSTCSGSGTGAVITNAVVSNFSPFTFGSRLAGINALPLTLANIQATCKTGQVEITFTDMSPTTTRKVIVEHSSDGINFTSAAELSGEAGSGKKTEHSFMHTPSAGISYYRLQQISTSGERFYSQLVTADCQPENSVSVYPNPGTGDFTIRGLSAGTPFVVLNSSGLVVLEGVAQESNTKIRLTDKGLYLLYSQGMRSHAAVKIVVH